MIKAYDDWGNIIEGYEEQIRRDEREKVIAELKAFLEKNRFPIPRYGTMVYSIEINRELERMLK